MWKAEPDDTVKDISSPQALSLRSRAHPFPGGRPRPPTPGCFSHSSPQKQEREWEPGGGRSLPGPCGIPRMEVGSRFPLPTACVRGLSPEVLGEAGDLSIDGGQRGLWQQSPLVSLLKVSMDWGRGSGSGRSSSGSWEDIRSTCPHLRSRCLRTLSSVVDSTDRDHQFPLCPSVLAGLGASRDITPRAQSPCLCRRG